MKMKESISHKKISMIFNLKKKDKEKKSIEVHRPID